MARINLYTASEAPAARLRGDTTAEDFGARLGRMVSAGAEHLRDKLERDQLFDVEREMADVRVEWARRVEELKKNSASGGVGFHDGLMREYKEFAERYVQGRGEGENRLMPGARQRLQSLLLNFGEALSGEGMKFQAYAAGQKRRNDVETLATNLSKTVFDAPDQFGIALDSLDKAVSALGVPVDDANAIRAQVKEDIAISTVQGFVQRGQYGLALKALDKGQVAESINGVKANNLKNQIDARMRSDAAAARIEAAVGLNSSIGNLLTSLQATGTGGNIDEQAVIRQATAAGWKEPQIAELRQKIELSRNIFVDRQKYLTLTPAEIAADLNERRAAVSGSDATMAQLRYSAAQEAARDTLRERQEDPARYAMTALPMIGANVRAAWEKNDPAMIATATDDLVAAQRSLGIADPSPLPSDVIDRLKKSWPTLPPNQLIDEILGLKASLGSEGNWKLVARQVAKTGTVEPSILSAIQRHAAGGVERRVVEELISSTMAIKSGEVKVPTGPEYGNAKSKFEKKLGETPAAALYAAGLVTGNATAIRAAEAERQGMETILATRFLATGDGNVADKVLGDFVGNRAAINVPHLAHVVFDGRRFDPELVRLGLQTIRNTMSLPTADGSRLEQLAGAQLYDDYRTGGVWVNDLSSSAGDLVLVLPGTTTAPVKPLRVSLEQALAAGQAERRRLDAAREQERRSLRLGPSGYDRPRP